MSLSMNADLIKWTKEEAKKKDLSVSAFVAGAIRARMVLERSRALMDAVLEDVAEYDDLKEPVETTYEVIRTD